MPPRSIILSAVRMPFRGARTRLTRLQDCGASLSTTSEEAPAADCSTPCGGADTQPCGGPDRLTLFHSPNVQGPSTNPGVNGFVSMGCYS